MSVLGRFQSNSGTTHWVAAAKKVLRYLKRTRDFMLTYNHVDSLEIVCYTDSDLLGFIDDKRSTNGYIFILAGGAISWKSSKKKKKVHYILNYGSRVHWLLLSHQPSWLDEKHNEGLDSCRQHERPLNVYCDNKAEMFFS